MNSSIPALTVALALVTAGAGAQTPVAIDPPAPAGSSSPALAVEGATTFNKSPTYLLSWLEPGEAGGTLKFSRLEGKVWSAPVTIAEDVSLLDAADDASLTVLETNGVRRTLIARTGEVVARSPDGGRAWTRLPGGPLPFSSFAGGEDGGYAFWLRGNNTESATLLGTRVLAGETVLDPEVKPRSQTAAAMTWDGPVLVYRDGSGDLTLVRREQARWTTPHPIHAPSWRPAGGSLGGALAVAALRRQVAVAWHTTMPHGPRILVAFSTDAGRTFAAPIELHAAANGPIPTGPVALTLADDGTALLAVRAEAAREATLRLTRVAADGRRGEDLVLARTPAIHLRGTPGLARAGETLAVAWTEGVLGKIHTSLVPLAAIPAPSEAAPTASAAAPYTGRGRVGDPLPPLDLSTLAGEAVSFATLKGKAVLLNVWATWCQPCIAELPELTALAERYREDGLVFVGLNVDAAERKAAVERFLAEHRLTFATWLDPEMHAASALRVTTLPVTFVIDRGGSIALRRDEPIAADDSELDKALRRALGKP